MRLWQQKNHNRFLLSTCQFLNSSREQYLIRMEKYVFIKEIGAGSFGKVFLVKTKQKGVSYVVKQVDLNKLNKKQTHSAIKEVEFLSKLRHNNIVSYKESYERNNQLSIVLEYCENGDLHDKIKEKRMSNEVFLENEILDYFVQICLALEYIHGQRILHRDLKTKNIFLTKGNIVKLGDFGIAKVLENSFELAQTCIGSPFYISPEICESKPYNKKSDVWALGCVLYELATLKYAFVARNVKSLLTKILTGAYNPLPSNINIHIRGLISVMLKPDPKDRPSVREILKKRFLVKTRATFICKAHHYDLERRRSKSGVVFRNLPNNGDNKNNIQKGKLSLSCLQLNQLRDYKKLTSISNPEAKYKPTNTNKPDKKPVLEAFGRGDNDTVNDLGDETNPDGNKLALKGKASLKCESKSIKFEAPKNIKLLKVDSRYYDLIVGRKDVENKDGDVSKQSVYEHDLKIKLNKKTGSLNKMGKTEDSLGQVQEEEGARVLSKPGYDEECTVKFGNEHRKRWMNNTLQKQELLAFLGDSELLEESFLCTTVKQLPDKLCKKASIDDMLSLETSEIKEDVLVPIKLYDSDKADNLQLLQHEINHLKEKFELNNKNYKMEDLMRLTDKSKKILSLEATQKYADCDRKVGESVFHTLEHRKMTLERKIDFCQFFKSYEKMMSIINDDLQSDLKNSLNNLVDGTKTYIIPKVNVSGDNDILKNTWKSIVSILGDKQEYLPDIWELAMSENIYYHL